MFRVNLKAFLHPSFPGLQGAPPLELRISAATLTLKAIDAGGEIADAFSISKLRLLRGDMDLDGKVDLGDAIGIVNGLFPGVPGPCFPAGNVNADGSVNPADAIYLLEYLFGGGPSPEPPFPRCGPIRETTLAAAADATFSTRPGC